MHRVKITVSIADFRAVETVCYYSLSTCVDLTLLKFEALFHLLLLNNVEYIASRAKLKQFSDSLGNPSIFVAHHMLIFL